MRHDNISISIPEGYAETLNEESNRYGLNRSEFLRVLFDGYLMASNLQLFAGKREPGSFFPEVMPHRRAECDDWLARYLRLVMRVVKESEEQKKLTGTSNGIRCTTREPSEKPEVN